MKRWPWVIIGTLFLIGDLVVAGLVYDRLDPGAAHAALRRLNLAPQATSTPTLPRTSTLPSVHASPGSGLVEVHGTAWNVDKVQPRTRVRMGIGTAFTWPDHRYLRTQYLVIRVYEANHAGGAVHFASSARDFVLRGTDSTAYRETLGFFNGHNMPRMLESKILTSAGKNVGGIAFDIPVRRGTYMILWKEPTRSTWFPVAKVAVGPGHKPIVSSSS